MNAKDILEKYISFFEKRGHVRIENSPLVPLNDPTTLFTSSGMQPLVPYLLGEPHPAGKRLVNVQNSFRAQDIDEIGDNRHTTFFRMLGNWSLGDPASPGEPASRGGYFKKEQIPWFFEFLTKELHLDPYKLYVTVFEGSETIPEDTEAIEIWKEEFKKVGIEAEVESRIFKYGVAKNWWSRSGTPEKMPIGEIGGPDTEVFYDFGSELKIHEKSLYKDQQCHPNCDCGRFLEIGNSVFIQYKKTGERNLEELPNKNVDFGGGLERLLAAAQNQPDIFKTHLYSEAIKSLEILTKTDSNYEKNPKPYRIIADHLNAATFLISSGVIPSNKGQGYVVRRLIRRAMIQARDLGMEGDEWFSNVAPILEVQNNVDGSLKMDTAEIAKIITTEIDQFRQTINKGLKIIENWDVAQLNALNAFALFQSHGFPVEISRELFEKRGGSVDMKEFEDVYNAHKKLSQTTSAKMFKGGLADNSEKTIMGHTATHLMHQALRDMFGGGLHQSGSNITSERVRFDFNFERKLTPPELKELEDTVNQKIKDNLAVRFEMIDTQKAKKMGAIGLFTDTYAKTSKIYFIGDEKSSTGTPKLAYSIEFCGGPHVNFTGEVKKFTILKQESLGKGFQRIYARVGE